MFRFRPCLQQEVFFGKCWTFLPLYDKILRKRMLSLTIKNGALQYNSCERQWSETFRITAIYGCVWKKLHYLFLLFSLKFLMVHN